MADLSIFGETRTFTAGGETYQGLGGFQNEVIGKLNAAGTSLDLRFSGKVAQGEASFQATFGCRVDNGRIELLGVASVFQTPSVRLTPLSGWSLVAPQIQVLSAGDRLGINFQENGPSANPLANFVLSTNLVLAHLRRRAIERWKGNLVSFDLPARQARFGLITSGGSPGLLFSDELSSVDGENSLFHSQVLNLLSAWIGDQEIGLQAIPESGALFLHADVLDTTFLKGPAGEDRDNDLLFQYALANGLFEITYNRSTPLQQGYRWHGSLEKSAGPAALVCFGLRDEHGHPLLLDLPEGARLHQRDGVTTEVAFETAVFRWEQTNRAALIEALPSPGQDEGRIPCRLRSLDPLSLPAGPRDHGSLTNPYWLNGGRVKAATKPPREIHGLAKGTFLARKGTGGDGLDCAIATRVVKDPALGKLFVRTDLVLPSAEGWTLMAQTEERELIPNDQPAVDQVGLRAAAGLAGELRLPMIDTSYAFANLTGLERVRRDSQGQRTGEYLASGVLAREGRQWIEEADSQLAGTAPSRFDLPALADQIHTSGFGVAPAARQPFHSILDRPPATAEIAVTARTGAWLMAAPVASALAALPSAPPRTALFFGGKRENAEQRKLSERIRNADTPEDPQTPAGAAERFLRLWADDSELTPPQREALEALRRALVAERPTDGAELTEGFFLTLLDRARELVQSNLPIPWLEAVRPIVDAWFIEELEEEWRTGTDPVLARLFEYLWAPPSMELFRRALGLMNGLPQAALLRELLPQTEAWNEVLKNNLEGFLTEMAQGVDALWDDAVILWRDEADAVLDDLRRRYGPTLTQDVYQALLKNARDAETLALRLRDTFGLPVERLADLKADPPDYLLITRRFETAGRQREGADALWYHRFDLCDFGQKSWHFFLDSGSTILVKLTGERTLPEVLREAEAAYRTPERPNPLGVPEALMEPGTKVASPVEALASLLHPDLLARSWRGVLIVAPTADISEDLMLKDLAGLEYIQAAYAALGGRKPNREKLHLDTYARIFQRAPIRPEETQSDVKLALIKFDATIKHTEIESGEIVFQLDLADLWGRQLEPRRPLYVRGTLPNAPEGGGPRSFEFAAWFEKPEEIKVGVAFVEAFAFRSIRVGSRQGRTSLDIDGEAIFRDSGISLPIELGGASSLRLGLENFRILLPQLGGGERFDFGFGRALDFDFPSVSFRLAKPRALNLFGIEIIPQGIGYLRGTALKALQRLRGAYTWISKLELPDVEAPDFTFPYLQLRIDFGKLPQFGAGGLSGLTFDALLGLEWKGHDLPTVRFGISGVSGKDLKLDLFRLLTLEIRELAINSFTAKLDASDPDTQVGAFIAEDVRLKILDWSPLPEGSKLSLMLIHPSDSSTRKGLLAWYGNSGGGNGFFRLYWLLLAHNLELRREVYNALLKGDPREMGEHPDLVKNLVDIPARQIQARVLDQESWIFGASFGLGEILDRCSFILHDQHYYGIRLSAPWLKPVFGQETVELAYIPGARPELDRFRTNLRIPGLNMIGDLKSGEIALEWGVNWDFLIDIGFPWQKAAGYDWFRAFSLPMGAYEAKFGFYLEKRTQLAPRGSQQLALSAGVGFYIGYYFGYSSSIVWLRAGIGIFAILQGTVVLEGGGQGLAALRGTIVELRVRGVVGIFAYGDGGIDVWILSARFRVSVQAAIGMEIVLMKNLPCFATYAATLSAGYEASVRVGSGWFSWTFSVSGSVQIGVSGRLLLN